MTAAAPLTDRLELPDRATIERMTSIPVLKALLDQIDDHIVSIETQLEHSTRNAAWEDRAVNALALFRAAKRWAGRRLAQLKETDKAKQKIRPAEDIHPLTAAAISSWPQVDVDAIPDHASLSVVEDQIIATVEAVRQDREDEIGQQAGNRDEAFLAATGPLIRHLNGLRSKLQNRRGAITRAMRKTAQDAPSGGLTFDQAFLKAARLALRPETFAAISSAADALLSAQAEAQHETEAA